MKNRIHIRQLAAVLAVLALFSLFGGCSPKTDAPPSVETGPRTLWVVTEQTKEDAMLTQIKQQISEFQKANREVKINLQILPTEEGARSIEMEKLRTQIMAGQGPDVYLLPNSKMVFDRTDTNMPSIVEPLFQDVTQGMHNGLFADISAYYDADDSLGKENFAKGVMDAGVLEDARFVLPIRYSFPVVYFEREGLTELGLDVDKMLQNVNTLLDELLEKGGTDWPGESDLMGIHSNYLLTLFSPVFDYEASTLQLDADTFTHYTETIKTLFQRKTTDWSTAGSISLYGYVTGEALWNTGTVGYRGEGANTRQSVPLGISTSTNALDAAILAKALGRNIEAVPLRSTDGSVVANIHYWGAVGANCAHPGTAYQFLREFLLEDTQWELNRPRYLDTMKTNVGETRYHTDGYIAGGLPVRIQGAVVPLQETVQYEVRHLRGGGKECAGTTSFVERREAVQAVTLTQADVPILDTVIDRAEFAPPMLYDLSIEFAQRIYQGGDLSTFIADTLQQLEWHISEG